MKKQLNKIASGAAAAGLFLLGGIMAGLGLSVVFALATFGLAMIGLAFLAAPLIALSQPAAHAETEEAAA